MKIIKTSSYDDDFKEKVAELAHDQWSGWMKYLFSKCSYNNDSSEVIPLEFTERWKGQMKTKYCDLSEEEQDSDKKEADKFISLFNKEKDQ